MKTPIYLVAVFSLTLCAPQSRADEQAPGATTAPDKPAPVRKPLRSAASLAGITNPGPAVVRGANVNLRGQPSLNSEVITKLNTGDKVQVLEILPASRPKADEPPVWAKINLPSSVAVWASALFVDGATHAVKANRLNLRAGAGENYSVVGRVEKGAVLKVIEAKGDWLKIEPPAGTHGFIAAHLVESEKTPALAVATPPAVPPTVVPPEATPATTNLPTTPVEPPTVAVIPPATTNEPAPPAGVLPPPPALVTPSPETPATVVPPAGTTPETDEEEVWVKRVVTREGVVRRSVSIQAPTYFVLESLDNKRVMNYIFSPSTNVVLKDFKGTRILVTGEESLDERWTTPVLTVEKLQVIEE